MVLYGILVALSAVIVGVYAVWNLTVRPPEIPQEPDPAPPPAAGARRRSRWNRSSPQDGSGGRMCTISSFWAGTGERQHRHHHRGQLRCGQPEGGDDLHTPGYGGKPGLEKGPQDQRSLRGAGVDVLKEEIEQTFGIPIDYYIYVDLKGFVALVDELEGVDVYIPEEMNYDDPYQDLHIHYTKGQHHLNGQQAMEVVRFRHNNDGSGYTDVGRAEMQRQVLVALAKKVVSWNSLTKVQEFVEIFQEYVKTDLSTTDMLYFASQAVGVDLDTGITQGTLEGRGEGVVRGYKYCFVFQAEDILPTLNELVNPYDQPLTEEDLDLPQAEYYWNGTVID